jgi:RNA polymerase sigma factor (sigma-70 family)
MSASDIELWEAVLTGDSRAWAELVTRYQALVYTVCTRSGLSSDEAADCFQQTWITLHRQRKTVREPSRLSAWLVTTAKREVLRVKRQKARTDTIGESTPDVRSTDPWPDEVLERLEVQAFLEAALKELGPRCQRLVDLFFFAPEERTYEEIAEALGISANSLGPIRRRCLDKLKEILTKNGFPGVRNDDPETL